MPAVIAMPRQPPIITRNVGFTRGDPELLALIMPVAINPATANATMLKAFAPAVGANAPRKGMIPPIMKLDAEALIITLHLPRVPKPQSCWEELEYVILCKFL